MLHIVCIDLETSQCIVLNLDVSHCKLCYKMYVLIGRPSNANYTILILNVFTLWPQMMFFDSTSN